MGDTLDKEGLNEKTNRGNRLHYREGFWRV